MKAPENLLIVRTDRIGDVVLSLPLARLVKKHYKDCKVTYLVRDYTRELVEDHPYINEVLILNESNGKVNIKSNIQQIVKFRFDAGIVVYPTFRTALILFLSGLKTRIGTGYRWYSFLFNKKVFEHRKYAEKHELEFNVNLLKMIGIDETINPDTVRFDLQVNGRTVEKINELFSEHNVDENRPVVIVHPGSGGSAVDLSAEKLKELAVMLSAENDITLIITGSASEKSLCEQLVVNDKVINLAGFLSIKEIIALINRCTVFVSNSTGPIHIAAALDKHTVGFYPNLLACSHKRWRPYSTKSEIFTPVTECKDCAREQCLSTNCMNTINMKDVFEKIMSIIKFQKQTEFNNDR